MILHNRSLVVLGLLLILLVGESVAFLPQQHGNHGVSFTRRYATIEKKDMITSNQKDPTKNNNDKKNTIKIVLVAGFESFNRDLYYQAAKEIESEGNNNNIELTVFADSDIRNPITNVNDDDSMNVNPKFARAMKEADAFIGSLIFDYDDVLVVKSLLPYIEGPRLLFECATEVMTFNQVGSFNMQTTGDGPAGPPPAVKAILSKFGSGKEEDRINGYLKLLKFGPDLLKYIPGDKASDLRTWLEAYRFWNQGGKNNVGAMFRIIAHRSSLGNINMEDDDHSAQQQSAVEELILPELEVTPDIGLLHPLRDEEMKSAVGAATKNNQRFFDSPASYVAWRESKTTLDLAEHHNFHLAPLDAPRVAVLLYRKHVITEQRYVSDLITYMEEQGIIPVPIFINGVEAHTIVRDLLTSDHEINGVYRGEITRDDSYQSSKAARIDLIVNTVGFPLVGGPAGSAEAGRNIEVADVLLRSMNVPYMVASPLLLQSIPQWRTNGVLGLQSVVLYSLPELDGAIDTVVLGGLVGDKIALVPERVRKLTSRVKGWVNLRKTPKSERKIAVSLYGFPPNVGAVGTAALLDVPKSLENLLKRLHSEGYDVGDFATDGDASGESLVAAMSVLCENPVITGGAEKMQDAVNAKIKRAIDGDQNVAATLAKPGGGLGGAHVKAVDVSWDNLEEVLGKFMTKKVRRAWPENERGPGVSATGNMVVAGLQVGNIWITVQPLLGVEGDPMRLLFERDLTPHPQYCAAYEYMRLPEAQQGFGSQAVIHLGMHGTVEWLPGQALGNDRQSWSDELVGDLPNIYAYAANNPSESILAKRRGYATLVSYNVPPYGRSGLYLDLANLKELVDEYRTGEDRESTDSISFDIRATIWSTAHQSGMLNDIPPLAAGTDSSAVVDSAELPDAIDIKRFNEWVTELSDYLFVLQDRLFSSGLHVLGAEPSDEELKSYLNAYFGEELSDTDCDIVIAELHATKQQTSSGGFLDGFMAFLGSLMGTEDSTDEEDSNEPAKVAAKIVSLLSASTEEMDSICNCLDGGFVPAKPGGDLLRDGTSVLPTGKNIYALDPYRMPSATAWARGQRAAKETLRQHQEVNQGNYPETVAVTLWGLDAIKTRGESVAIVLALVGAEPIKEGTGRIVRFDLIPLERLSRPRVDVLASLSGIFRDSFANVVDLLDDMFERAAGADEPIEMNYIKKHSDELRADGVERPAARLFSNPPGDYGSMVNEVVGTGDWSESESLGETWTGRNAFSYGRSEGTGVGTAGTARPQVLDKLLETTERVVQEIDSVEYGLSDIQEYYANTGALKKAAENRKGIDSTTGKKKKVSVSIIEAFSGSADDDVQVQELEDVLRLEYRSKMLNPKWRDQMLKQGSGGAYEISQRMTAMVGWAATAEIDNFVFDQAAERYALDEDVAQQLQRSNPEAFKNVVRRLLEAQGRGMWTTDDDTLAKLRDLYADADDQIEMGGS